MLQQNQPPPKRPRVKYPKFVPFRLLDAPLKAQKKIIAMIDVSDSIHFSLQCDKYLELLREFKLNCLSLDFHFINQAAGITVQDKEDTTYILAATGSIRIREKTYSVNGEDTILEVDKGTI